MPGLKNGGRPSCRRRCAFELKKNLYRKSSNAALSAHGATAGYGELFELSATTCTMRRGKVYGMIGPNGSGKTTLLRMLSGALPAKAGRVEFMGENLDTIRVRARSQFAAFMPQQLDSPVAFRVADLVAMGRIPYRSAWSPLTGYDRDAVRTAMLRTGVEQLADRLLTTLSGGELQRAVLAKALAQEPRILFLDEPTAHLDIQHVWQLMELICELCVEKELTVVLTLHDLNLAAEFCDELLLLQAGSLVSVGKPSEVLKADVLSKVYNHPLKVVKLEGRLRVEPERRLP